MKITVLMPVLNAREWLNRAVESILYQDHKDLTFLIIDNGSTDGSFEILRDWAKKDKRIELIDNKGGTFVQSLNLGIQLSKTELIARMDADDACSTKRISVQLKLLNESPKVAAVGCGAKVIGPKGRVLYNLKVPTEHKEIVTAMLNGKSSFIHGSAVFRKKAVVDVGGYREEALPAEDIDLWLRLSEKYRLANIKSSLYEYRVTEKSITQRNAIKVWLKRRWVIECSKARREGKPEPKIENWEKEAIERGYWKKAKAWALRANAAALFGLGKRFGAFVALVRACFLDPFTTFNGLFKILFYPSKLSTPREKEF